MAAPKSRAQLPHLPYPKMNVTRTINAHRAAAGGGAGLLTGLSAWWSLNETSGTRYDSHSNGLDLTDNNTVGSATGVVGNCADFVATNSEYLSVADNAALDFTTAFSCSFWAKNNSASFTNYQTFIAKGAFPTNPYTIYQAAGPSTFRVLLNPPSGSLGVADVPGWSGTDWVHVVVNYDGSGTTNADKVQIYFDTVQQTLGGLTQNIPSELKTDSSVFMVGVNPFASNPYLNGKMDELALWSRTLTTDEISDLYNAGSGISYGDL